MERLQKKLDAGSFKKLTDNLVNNVSLWDMDDDDLKEIGIIEKGPRKIILRFIERHAGSSDNLDNTAENEPEVSIREFEEQHQQKSVRSVLESNTKFHMTLTRQLDYGVIPDVKKLRLMNRILTEHYFSEQMLKQNRYPTWQEKQQLACRIIEQFPHLAATRITEDAPHESYFFWRHGGLEHGAHTGLIETRVSNMRKDVLPENRQFRRSKKEKLFVDDEVNQVAAHLSALLPTSTNARQISEGMTLTFVLHKSLLHGEAGNKCDAIVEKFPHLLAYDGEMIIQAFQRIHQNSGTHHLKVLLRTGLLLDESIWNDVEDEYIRGALRLMKSCPIEASKGNVICRT
ncbi:uncharacterized protein LOC134202204 [Armigeres subalbatus]|uniref:uncharacterized protein LOC134202204 n=1 Tax=Armigeres subalbatus TaxID=124917 RepID=UPI002ECFDCF8